MSGGVTGSPQPEPSEPGPKAGPRCYRHPDRETYISCQRCGRPICPQCMQQAAVGFHCPECMAQSRSATPRPRTVYGGAVRGSDNIVTLVLIGLNVAVFLLITITGGNTSPVLNAMVLTGGSVAAGEWWRLVTAMFVHVELLHLFFNMLALWIFGPVLERMLGRVRFLTLYLLAGLVGSVAVYWLTPPGVFTLGASGAVFGLLGAALVVTVRRGYDAGWLLALLAINLVFSFAAPGISWQGHIGGLVGGLVIGAVIAWAPRKQRTMLHTVAFLLVFAVCVALIVARTAQLTA